MVGDRFTRLVLVRDDPAQCSRQRVTADRLFQHPVIVGNRLDLVPIVRSTKDKRDPVFTQGFGDWFRRFVLPKAMKLLHLNHQRSLPLPRNVSQGCEI